VLHWIGSHNPRFCLMVCSLSSPGLSGISTAASGTSRFKHETCSSEEFILLFAHDTFSVTMGNARCVSNGFAYGSWFLTRGKAIP
jgi:hypothetical protein